MKDMINITNEDGTVITVVDDKATVREMSKHVETALESDLGAAGLGMLAVVMGGGTIDEAMDVHTEMSAADNLRRHSFPIDCNLTDEELESLGFIIGEKQDRYLRTVTLPKGWELRRGHMMHNNLHDDKGRNRAWVMMDNRPWDRAASCSFNERFVAREYHDKDNYSLCGACIIDRAGTEDNPSEQTYLKISELNVIQRKGDSDEAYQKMWDEQAELRKLVQSYETILDTEYPDHKNILAYWEV